MNGYKLNFRKVPFEDFEFSLIKHPNLTSIDTDRDYTDLTCYLSPLDRVGYCISSTKELKFVFSLVKGLGEAAVKDAISRGADNLNCFDGKLTKYYEQFGFGVWKREANWTLGEPDVVYMTLGYKDDDERIAA